MGILSNPRHERFAQALAKGKTADEAYQEAGYKANRGNASTLKANQNVEARLAELQGKAAGRVEITIAKLTEMLLEDRRLAYQVGQPAAAVSAGNAIAKLHGLMVDRSKSEVEHRYVARAPTPARTVDEWMNRVKPNGVTTIPRPEPAKLQ